MKYSRRTKYFRGQRVQRTLLTRGFTLVEIMVALTIGIVLSMGILALVDRSARGFKDQDAFARLQENGYFALRYLGEAIRHAGFYGYLYRGDLVRVPPTPVSTTAVNDCGGANWAFDTDETMTGGGSLAWYAAGDVEELSCIHPANFADSPILVTRAAERTPEVSGALATKRVYVQSDPNGGILFYGGDYANIAASGRARQRVNGTPAPIYAYAPGVYYLRPCARLDATGVCSAGSDNGRPIPTLVRQQLADDAPTRFIEMPLVEGVERLILRFGIDNDVDGVAEKFIEVPTAAQMARVVDVEVTLLMRTPQIVPGHDDTQKIYNLGNGTTFQCAGEECRYRRHIFSQTFRLMNMAPRRAG